MPTDLEAQSPKPASISRDSLPMALLATARPRQWTKNGLLFLGLLFSLSLTEPELVLRAALGFVDFCLFASATYFVNDLADLQKDREHPIKRKRPIAAGRISPPVAAITALLLLVAAIALAFHLGTDFAVVGLLYPTLTFSYSLWLKHMVILDAMALASGFVLRAAAGAVVVQAPISPWLYVCTILGALFLTFSKRRHELILLEGSAGSHRRILEEYTVPLLDQIISVVASATVIAYSLYTFTAPYLPRNQAMMLTIPFVLYGIFRYLYLMHMKGAGGSPEEVLLGDRPIQVTIVGWGAVATVILYVFK